MTDPINPQQLAEAVGRELYAHDRAVQALGVTLEEIRPGHARMRLVVREDMTNGHGICHGGVLFTLADAALGYACNSYNHAAVASGCSIEYLAPAHAGDALTAASAERFVGGHIGVYDVTITNQQGKCIALFRGKSHRIQGLVVPVLDADQLCGAGAAL